MSLIIIHMPACLQCMSAYLHHSHPLSLSLRQSVNTHLSHRHQREPESLPISHSLSLSLSLSITLSLSLTHSLRQSITTHLSHRHQREPEPFRDGQEDKPGEEDPNVVPKPLLRLQGEGSEAREEGDHAQLYAHHGDAVHVAVGGEG